MGLDTEMDSSEDHAVVLSSDPFFSDPDLVLDRALFITSPLIIWLEEAARQYHDEGGLVPNECIQTYMHQIQIVIESYD
jgi:hypothetical protein